MGTLAGVAYWPADTSAPVLELTTGDLLREAAADAGTQTAIAEAAPPGSPSLAGAERTDRRWTYQELLAEAEQCAHWLLTRFSPGERIAIWAPNIPEWIILQYGAALAGLVVVTANPALRAAELRYVLGQSRSAGLFHTAAFRGSDMTAIVREAAVGLPGLRSIFFALRTGGRPWVRTAAVVRCQRWSQTTPHRSSTPRGPPGSPRARCCTTAG